MEVMTQDLRRHLRAIADERPGPGQLEAVLARTEAIRPRSTVLSALQGTLVDTRRRLSPSLAVRVAIAVAVLVVLALLALALIGSQHRPQIEGLFAYSRDGVVYLARPDGGGSVPVARQPAYYFTSSAWSPDGSNLAINKSPDGRFPDADPTEAGVVLLDAQNLELRRVAEGSFGGWTADGTRFLATSQSAALTLHDWRDGSSRTIIAPAIGPLSLSPNGRWIAGMRDRVLVRVDIETDEVVQLYDNGGEMSDTPVWSPDSSRIAFARTLSPNCHTCMGPILVMAADGSNPIAVSPPNQLALRPAWSPDGRWLAFVSNTGLEVVRSDRSTGRHLVDALVEAQLSALSWNPDGTTIRYLADSLEETGTRLKVWEVAVAGGQPRRIDDGSGAEAFSWQALPAGASIRPLSSLDR